MPDTIIGPVTLNGVDFETWLLKFDKNGTCESEKTRAALLKRVTDAPPPAIVVFSHGWNNEYADAKDLYREFLVHLQDHLTAHPPNVPLLFIGIIWPSTWLSFDTGPKIAAAGLTSLEEAQLADELASGLSEPDRKELKVLLNAPQLDVVQARQMTGLLSKSLGTTTAPAAREAAESASPDADTLFKALYAVQMLTPLASGANDDDDEGGTVDGHPARSLRSAGWLSAFDPRKAIRIASVYQMKDRAGTVGVNGVSNLVDALKAAAPNTPLHLVGHSFGAKVMMSALAHYEGEKVESVLLLQPAISHLCMEDSLPDKPGTPGAFHAVPGKIRQALIATYSGHDVPLHDLFHLALLREEDVGELDVAPETGRAGRPPNKYAALGGYGPPQAYIRPIDLPIAGTHFDIPIGGHPQALDGTLHNRIDGHGDVTTPITAWLLYLQLRRGVSE